mgnify:CR=1 FL=1
MYRIILSFVFLLLINLSYVDLHAYSHLLGDNDNPIHDCDHDDAFRNGETIAIFLLPTKINLNSSILLYVKNDKISEFLSYTKVRFLSSFYTNLPPPDYSLV